MKNILFIIPNYSSNVTGSSKRAENLSRSLSKKYKVTIFSADLMVTLHKGRILEKKNIKNYEKIFLILSFKFDYWFCDHIRWSIIPIPGLIFTLHDMKEWTKYGRIGFIKKIALYFISRKAKILITVSENQKKLINKYLKVNSYVFQNAVTEKWLKNKSNEKNFRKEKSEYILYVSNFTEHKGHLDLVNKNRNLLNYKILLVGTAIDNKGLAIMKYLDKLKNVKIYSNISEKRLKKLIKNSSFSVFPSMYEGYGMPILETVALQKKILINNCLKLQHFKKCSYIREVDFKKGVSLKDIKWAKSPNTNKLKRSESINTWDNISDKIYELLQNQIYS